MTSRRKEKKYRKHKYHNGVYDEEFAVERILAKKMVGNEAFYKVKWLGYPLDECTWEPLTHLSNVLDMISQFEQENSMEDSLSELSILRDGPVGMQAKPIVYGDLAIDKPLKVIGGRKVDGKILCTVMWYARPDGIQPAANEIPSEELKEDYLDLLLDFYESKINF